MDKKKKAPLSPEAEKLLEKYRSAGRTLPSNSGIGPNGEDTAAAPKPSQPPPQAIRQRSGTRGK